MKKWSPKLINLQKIIKAKCDICGRDKVKFLPSKGHEKVLLKILNVHPVIDQLWVIHHGVI